MARSRAIPTLALLRVFTAASAIFAAACDGGGAGDASVGEGGSVPGLPTCSHPAWLEGVEDGTVLVELDTSSAPDGSLELDECADTTASPPQAVVAYRVPGAGAHAVTVSTVNTGTDRTFDTVLAVRREICDGAPTIAPPSCFDDKGTERRASGTVLAEGGETVYVIVTGYPSAEATVDRGPVRVEITARAHHAPTISEASVLVTPSSVRIDVRASDVDGDGAGVRVTFHGPARELLDIDGDRDADELDVLVGAFDRSVSGAITWNETATIDRPMAPVGGATEAWVRVTDETGAASVIDIAVPVRTGEIVGSGDACDASRICARELECRATVCAATADREVACAAATAIVIAPPTTSATSGSAESVLLPGEGSFTGECGSTSGREALFDVSIPTGGFDLLATTDTPGTATNVDTILYARTACVDPASAPENACADDIEAVTNERTNLVLQDLGPGVVTIFVEHFGGVPADQMARFELRVTLRPVLDMGESCDPTGVMNRCTAGDCPASTRVCP